MIDTDPSPCEVLPPVRGELVPAANMAALEALDPQNQALQVTSFLGQARSWLAHAKEATEPQPIANFHAQMVVTAEAAKQLGLSKEIQVDAVEMVRRAEHAVGFAIRKGQDEGTLAKRGDIGGRPEPGARAPRTGSSKNLDLVRPKDVVGAGNANELSHYYELTDGVTSDQFEEAITEAKNEGNLSHANVVRKAKGQPKPEGKRHELLKNTHHHDVARIVEQTAFALEGLVLGLGLVAPGTVPEESKAAHTKSIGASLSKIRTFLNSEMRLP